MSLKRMLGLEECALTDYEIMKYIEDAYARNNREVAFDLGQKRVTIRLNYPPKGKIGQWPESW